MPRIRSIKPEFCTSEQIAECSPNARLLFVLMWMFCDDAGRHPANARRLKMECFPGDDFTIDDITGFVREMHAAGLLVEFEFEGKRYWQVTGWHHQKIDKPNAKYGPLTTEKRGNGTVTVGDDIRPYIVENFGEYSTTIRRTFDDSSPQERKGEEGRGEEGRGVGIDEASSTPTASKQSSVQRNPPSVDDVSRYMADRGYPNEADAFVDHYTANGWVQGRGKPIKDWQAAVRNWQRNSYGKSASASTPVTFAQQRLANTSKAIEDFANG